MSSSALEVDNLEEAKKLVRDLRQKTRAQAQQIMAWRKAFKMQEIMISRIEREKSDQLKALSSKLLLFESRLIRKQKDISTMLNIRETIIHRQQKIIETLSNRLQENNLEVPEITEMEYAYPDLDSLNDSDSAVVMEDIDLDQPFQLPKFRNMDGVTVMRSISDAIDPNLKYSSIRRNNGFLRRPEILETVYSVEEDGDNDQDNKIDANKRRESFATRGKSNCQITDKSQEEKGKSSSFDETISWSCKKEKVESTEENSKNQVKKYNRVMLNHRSVTKPKDVKYKRINKAKSKSLEELRGKLKNWVEQGTKISGYSLEHSQSYA